MICCAVCNSNDVEVKPIPLGGGQYAFRVECNCCDNTGGIMPTREEAILSWNRQNEFMSLSITEN